jgi:acyl-CoA ligase (AMP-forming) (exosortase A-associated)
MSNLVHKLIYKSANQAPDSDALVYRGTRKDYATLSGEVESVASNLISLGLCRSERLAVYLEKRHETVISLFGATAAGGVFVPVNPILKPEQVSYILCDCNVKILVTSADRLNLLITVLPQCPDLHTVVVVDSAEKLPVISRLNIIPWNQLCSPSGSVRGTKIIDSDMAAILYTSGSTGKPKGVVLSHRNIVAGAESVAQYLENGPNDRILSVLPLSFDYGFNQLTTAFYTRATCILSNHLFPWEIIETIQEKEISGLAAVPPLWIQLAQLNWPKITSLRYITNSGGTMPQATLGMLRSILPKTKVFLMYGLTEAFRSTYLSPQEVDIRPNSIGKAIPNAEVLVLREDGTPCAPGEPGELVHRGALVSMGYWNNLEKTSVRFRPFIHQKTGLPMPEIAVWSGDTVRSDNEGYLYFICRQDEMIKTSGYRVSPTEVEEVAYATKLIGEAVAIGIPHLVLGQAIVLIVTPRKDRNVDVDALLAAYKLNLPAFMLPSQIILKKNPLPRNSNGKIDRPLLYKEIQNNTVKAKI